MTVTQLIIT